MNNYININNKESLGRQVSLDKQVTICRNFIMGICFKHPSQCSLRHEFDIDEIQKTLQFCHDYQNRGCLRDNCSFLHTTKEEEKLFKTSRVLPQVLCERYSAMAATANMSNPETVQQIAMYINESFGGQLPPPPPLGVQTLAAPPPPPPPAPLPVQLAPPPPPPPAATVPTTRTNTIYPPMPVKNGMSNLATQPPPAIIPQFNASVPPPPFYPMQVQENKNAKRPAVTIEAGPSKVRKAGGSTPEIPCGECVQKVQSIGLYKKELDRLHTEEEHLSLIYKKKMEEFEEMMGVLKALVDPDMLKFWEIYVEDVPQPKTPAQDMATQLGQIATLASTGTSMSRILILAELLKNRGMVDSIQPVAPAPPPSVRLNDSLLQTLTTIQRRMSSPSTSSTSYELRQAIEAIRNSEPDRLPSQLRASDASRQASVATTISGSNGIRLSSIANTVEPAMHTQYSGPSGANRYTGNFGLVPPVSATSGANSRYPGTQANMYQAMGTPGPSGLRPTATHPSYHPGIPPPVQARPFYGPNNPRAAAAPPAPPPPGPSQDSRYHQYPPYPPYNVQQYPPY